MSVAPSYFEWAEGKWQVAPVVKPSDTVEWHEVDCEESEDDSYEVREMTEEEWNQFWE